jgi:hypothetical protein
MRREPVLRTLVALALALSGGGAAAGTSALLDRAGLSALIERTPECCVIDARKESERVLRPIAFAIELQPALRIKAGSTALVVADDDARALAVAQAVAARSDGDAMAVKGGYATWQALRQASTATSSTLPKIFTIPSNTCEQGKALHEFKR